MLVDSLIIIYMYVIKHVIQAAIRCHIWKNDLCMCKQQAGCILSFCCSVISPIIVFCNIPQFLQNTLSLWIIPGCKNIKKHTLMTTQMSANIYSNYYSFWWFYILYSNNLRAVPQMSFQQPEMSLMTFSCLQKNVTEYGCLAYHVITLHISAL